MNTLINRKTRSKTFGFASIAAVTFLSASSFLPETASAQQVVQQTMKGIAGTVVRVRLAPTLSLPQGTPAARLPLPDLVEVAVQGSDGEMYEAIANRARQPRLGTEVMRHGRNLNTIRNQRPQGRWSILRLA
ncbi:hypothetical protein A8H39_00500 [Paraburkholderia fungorum]|uniref:hypothetical protein n=1 Tax=Paraburkholderia fungorum TaxID=134537 RepID=UPI00048472CE|nr:hypothetical protein [Paraburkholderia fungorum]PNE59664.1 hypothetical protein A8H39_00500 [Paraburkholderia fungorum]